MKPYFLDELRSFKMKDQLSKINTPLTTSQKTALENKVKVLELENNLLKSDVFYMKDLLILSINSSKYFDYNKCSQDLRDLKYYD